MVAAKKKKTLPKLNRQHIFLKIYAECGNLTVAAVGAQIDVRAHYKWLEDEEYRTAFDTARNTALDLLEAEARRRAIEGDEEPAVYQGGLCYERLANGRKKQIVYKRKSDNLLMFLLKAGRPEQYRDTWKGEIKHSGAIGKGPDLSSLTNEQLAELNTLLRLTSGEAESPALSGPPGDGEAPEDENQ